MRCVSSVWHPVKITRDDVREVLGNPVQKFKLSFIIKDDYFRVHFINKKGTLR